LTDRLIAEQVQAEQKRSAELVKANAALKQTVDVLATETDLDHFLGHVLRVIAAQLNAPPVQTGGRNESVNRRA